MRATIQWRDFKVKRIWGLLYPYMLYCLILIVYSGLLLLAGYPTWLASGMKPWLYLIYWTVSGYGVGTPWFLTALLGATMLAWFFIWSSKRIRIFCVILFSLAWFGVLFKVDSTLLHIYYGVFAYPLIFAMRCVIVVPFLLVGYYYAHWKSRGYLFLPILLVIDIIFYFDGMMVKVDLCNMDYGVPIAYYLCSMVGSFLFIILFKYFYDKWYYKSMLLKCLEYVGRHSILYMFFNCSIIAGVLINKLHGLVIEESVLGYSLSFGIMFSIETLETWIAVRYIPWLSKAPKKLKDYFCRLCG